jgi:photosystem II stability/assembly factor-like uncharacterized protein
MVQLFGSWGGFQEWRFQPSALWTHSHRGHPRLCRRRAWVAERLENRALLAGWVEQGPGPIFNGDVAGMEAQHNPVTGAVEVLAPDSTNPDVLYAGTVNGGIWKTNDATSTSPTWLPLTDHLPSLSISDLAMSPVDPTHRTLYAATGSFSNGIDGGPGAGIYKTTDGGATWLVLGRKVFGDVRIRSVVPTALDGGQVVLAGARAGPSESQPGGVYRSADGGATWKFISGTGNLPVGPVSFLTGDPGNANRFYATIQEPTVTRIFRSDDGGLTWTSKTEGITGNVEFLSRIELAIHNDLNNNVVYAAVMSPQNGEPKTGFTGALTGFFRSTDQGEHWTAMALPGDVDGGIFEEGMTGTNFAMAADPIDPNVVYVSGDQEAEPFPKANGCTDPVDRSFRGDASQPLGSQWTALDCNGATGTAPHEDSRDLKFDARGDLLQANDGGIFRLINPSNVLGAEARHWVATVGNLRSIEMYSVAYDPINNVILGAMQDNGAGEQFPPTWGRLIPKDGVVVQTDQISIPGSSIHYFEADYGAFFTRATFSSSHQLTDSHLLDLIINGTGGKRLFYDIDDTNKAVQPFELNTIDPKRMLIGTQFLYESFDRGDHLDRLAGGANIGQVTALAAGGRLHGVDNPDVAYVGTMGDAKLLLRTRANGAFRPLKAYPGGTPLDIAVEPRNWHRAYVVDSNNHVWATFNGGKSWRNITGNLKSLTPSLRVAAGDPSLRTVAVIGPKSGPGSGTVLVGGFGGVFAIRHPGLWGSKAKWAKLGDGLPNVVVRDVRYDATDDIVIAGTFGRGAWTLPHPIRVLRRAGNSESLRISAGRRPIHNFSG